ncbi:Bug family tripartite tricarboxylate transporter substrate binding protein [Ramlibacter sp.]|uniref:Bug family tripartite tricarboxylate transporter substrate binding protein n=1 Tax=Ramlibacter sp. TaxID=1917967 RepID=UPI003D14AAA2
MNLLVKAACALAVALPLASLAQSYPTKPVRIVIPLSTGSTTDIFVRAMAVKLGAGLGQPVVIDNQPGAGGMLGTAAVARAAPDGYTWLVVTSGAFAANPHLRKEMPYSPSKDFVPVCRIGLSPYILVAHPSLGVRSVQELLAKAKTTTLSFASAGVGSSPHMAQEMFKSRTGMPFLHVPYKGTAQAVTDTMGGHAQVLMDSPGPLLPHIRAGKLVALGMTGGRRLASAPEVPTFEELGFAGLRLEGWIGLALPASTPGSIVARASEACQSAVAASDLQTLAREQGLDADHVGPREFGEFIASESQKWGDLIRRAGIKPE